MSNVVAAKQQLPEIPQSPESDSTSVIVAPLSPVIPPTASSPLPTSPSIDNVSRPRPKSPPEYTIRRITTAKGTLCVFPENLRYPILSEVLAKRQARAQKNKKPKRPRDLWKKYALGDNPTLGSDTVFDGRPEIRACALPTRIIIPFNERKTYENVFNIPSRYLHNRESRSGMSSRRLNAQERQLQFRKLIKASIIR
ncbi:hypothetical protein SISSUDRAFT_932787 [Sistotremastrum suecicum HHB10207 ss-3]|uniref:Uncharacterized protein n=1 Tax=Sistotremastrum suecicum HHB10207 ss-3 TaxID=1314776 RepID=A0A166BRJ3_9AGAM|nr:hypothetical protein SISSUDRAFT_932787 [Sistotremastrum suecicum HHB10207 ss-3]